MNYIQQLKMQAEADKRDKMAACAIIDDLTRYLLSDKFSIDSTVQVRDVLNRLEGIRDFLYVENVK